MQRLIDVLGDEVDDPDEECFLVFAQTLPSQQNLGFVDPKASTIDLTIAGKDVTIRQSPGLLSSHRKEGTTGAVLWKITPLFAAWISSPTNLLARTGLLHADANVLELGCGVSGLVSLALAPQIAQYINTDQDYVLKYVKENVELNSRTSGTSASAPISHQRRNKKSAAAQPAKGANEEHAVGNIHIAALDWETSDLSKLYQNLQVNHLDIIVSCDCIYNEALVDPYVSTMRDICLLDAKRATVCAVAQQLRSADVFEVWLRRFHQDFRVWRVPEDELGDGLSEGSGYVVHIGVLR